MPVRAGSGLLPGTERKASVQHQKHQDRSPSTAARAGGGPLVGIKVVDASSSYAGPTAAMYLADLGASVIKLERPAGDDTRTWGPPFVDGSSAWFASANRNKRSIALDLKSTAGAQVFEKLLEHADVLIGNVNPAKLGGLGLDPSDVRRRHPRLVYCALSGLGLNGPDSGLPGYDLVAQARSGLMSVTGAAGGQPQRVSTALSDVVTGMAAALAVCAAVVNQQATGQGDLVDVSLLDSDLALMAPRIASFMAGESEPAPSGGTDSVLAVYQVFPTSDRDIVVAIGNDAIWGRFCRTIGLGELATDDRLQNNAGRREHRAELIAAISERLVTGTAASWLQAFGAAGVPGSLVKRLSEVTEDPQVVSRGSLLPVPSSDGRLVSLRPPFRLASQAEARNERFPELGEHSREVLAECGYGESEIDELIGGAVVLTADGAALADDTFSKSLAGDTRSG